MAERSEKLNGTEAGLMIAEAGTRSGSVRVPSSKSQLHRLLILAAASEEGCSIRYDGLSKDIKATADCLRKLGAGIDFSRPGIMDVTPMEEAAPQYGYLPCGESGSTLRFLLPFAGAFGADCGFRLEGRLPQRPLSPLDSELRAHGMSITRASETDTLQLPYDLVRCSGQLMPGTYTMPGNVSSQYISGLLMALPLLGGDSLLEVTGHVESAAYVDITLDVLARAGIEIKRTRNTFEIAGGQRPVMPENMTAEGDWSSAAFFLCMGALSEKGICVEGMNMESCHGDRTVVAIIRRMGALVTAEGDAVTARRGRLHGIDLDASDVPDLVPAIAALAASAEGITRISGAARLRLKESDRLKTTTDMLSALGADIKETADGLIINGKDKLRGGRCSSGADHRIAMAAAVAASACEAPVVIEGASCVSKSYPRFFEDLKHLKVEKA